MAQTSRTSTKKGKSPSKRNAGKVSKVNRRKTRKSSSTSSSRQSTPTSSTSSISDKSNLEEESFAELQNGVSPPLPRTPPKFSWIVPGLLSGQGRPTLHGHVQYLCDNNFKYLVTLTLNKPRAIREYPGPGLTWIHIPIQDETPPTLDQIQTFCDAVDQAEAEQVALSAHCAWGRGRTGTMMACYLAKRNAWPAARAITEIRKLRPGSIDTDQQAESVSTWVAHIVKNK